MHSVKGKPLSVLLMVIAQFGAWLRSPRVLIISIFVLVQCFTQVCGFRNTLNRNGYSVYQMESIFYQFYFGCNMPMMSVLFLVMIGDVPYRMAKQEFQLIRCSRKRWIVAQILYCVLIVATMIIVLLISIVGMTAPISTAGSGWSDDLRMATWGFLPEDALIEEMIRANFTPLGATCFAIIPMFCFWLLMLLIIVAFSIRGIPEVGILMYASLLVLNITVLFEMIPFRILFPMDYATLEGIVSNCTIKGKEQFCEVFFGYGAMILVVILFLVRSAENYEISSCAR